MKWKDKNNNSDENKGNEGRKLKNGCQWNGEKKGIEKRDKNKYGRRQIDR